MNVPNHSQASRIGFDLALFSAAPDKVRDWQGNSYQGRAYKHDGIWIYELVHWRTTIAQFALIGGDVVMTYFDARYISSTTRGFQGRIVSGMRKVFQTGSTGWLAMVNDELALPTAQRGIISPAF